MKKCLKRTKILKITSILKISIIWHVVPQIECGQAFCQFWAIFVSLPHFWCKKSKFLKNENKNKKKTPARDTVDSLYLDYLLSISNFSPFRTKSSVPWTFVYSLGYFYLFISNFYISIFFSISNKNLGPLPLFLSLSRNFFRLRVHLHSK